MASRGRPVSREVPTPFIKGACFKGLAPELKRLADVPHYVGTLKLMEGFRITYGITLVFADTSARQVLDSKEAQSKFIKGIDSGLGLNQNLNAAFCDMGLKIIAVKEIPALVFVKDAANSMAFSLMGTARRTMYVKRGKNPACIPTFNLQQYAYERLSPEKKASVTAHLEQCADCRERLAAIENKLEVTFPKKPPEKEGV